MNRPALEALQLERLNSLLRRVDDAVPFYRRRFAEAGVEPSVTTLEDLADFPFTVKDDLRAAYPFGMFAVPIDDIVRIHSSSGTTGQVTVAGYTRNDIEVWSDLMARTLVAAGATREDIVQVAYGYGLFTGGLGTHYGSERLGCATIPISGGNTQRQVKVLRDFGTTILACTPSYAMLIGETAIEMGIDPRDLPLRAGVFGAEPWSENLRRQIQELLGISAIDIYGLAEIMGPGVASECQCQCGMHVAEDHFLVEILDPATLRPVADGEWGEVIFTTLTKEGIPLVRYRTRDISRILTGECACGRTFRRLARFAGRTDDMLIIHGVNVFPGQIEQVLLGIPGVAPHYQLMLTKHGPTDHVEIHVEVSPEVPFGEVRVLEQIRDRVAHGIVSALAVHIPVKLVEPKSIERSEGKAKRVIDLRNERQ